MATTLARRVARNQGLPSIFAIEPFHALRDEFDQLLSNWFADSGQSMPASFSPLLDLNETDSAYEVQVDLPGVKASEINVQLHDNVLTISGERKYEKTDPKDKDKKGSTPHFVERYHGTFSRSIVLPAAVKQDKIDAKFQDGVLKLTLPKADEVKPVQIAVKS
jgi:HSP20 family protein